ncbi:MAG: hypothetical protein ACX94D_08305 [Henriciella sp.]
MTPTTSPVVVAERLRRARWSPATIPTSPEAVALIKEATEAAELARKQIAKLQGKTARTLSAPKQKQAEQVVGSIVLDALAFHLTGDQDILQIPCNTSWLTSGPSDQPARCRSVPKRLEELIAAEWLVQVPFRSQGYSVTSTEAGPRLLEAATRLGVSIDGIGQSKHYPSVVVKGTKDGASKRREVLKESQLPSLETVQHELNSFNDILAASKVGVRDGAEPIDTRRLQCSRVFLDGSLQASGRLTGGFWLNLRKQRRKEDLLVDGQRIAEVDLRAAQPTLAYAMLGHSCGVDPYDLTALGISDISRDASKCVMMQMLWQPIDASSRLPTEARKAIPSSYRASDVYNLVRQHNEPIRRLLGNPHPVGAHLMHLESEVIMRAVRLCYSDGFTALPLHDALLTCQAAATRAADNLKQAFASIMGVTPEVTVDMNT